MAAMWAPEGLITQPQGDADIRESASVAHIYGKRLVAAESMTAFGTGGAAYALAPDDLKSTADRELADGLNLFVIHTSVHQPLIDKVPGITLGPFGQWFTRNEPWAEDAGAWTTYLARSSYLLQQGRFVADVLYYYGQDSNITALYGEQLPPIPVGYAFDFANAHALTMLSVQDGYLVTASGMRYRILALDPRSRNMSLDVLQTIAKLVKAGATVVGEKPVRTPSLVDDESVFHNLADAVWGDGTTNTHEYGAGHVIDRMSLADSLAKLNLDPDFSYSKPRDETSVWFVHRKMEKGDLYFLNNRNARPEHINARFRVSGRLPELWHADSGVMEPASYRNDGDHTTLPLTLAAREAVFVLFLVPTTQTQHEIKQKTQKVLTVIRGPWHVSFQPGRGAPARVEFSQLESWSNNPAKGIKYFSGRATYRTEFRTRTSWLVNHSRVELDLGKVSNVAHVVINGHFAGMLWKEPFRVDVTRLLRGGDNELTITVSNLWVNRLIGDKQPGERRIAMSTYDPFQQDSQLLPAGLLGPVTLVGVQKLSHPSARR